MKAKRLYAKNSISFLDIIDPIINTRIEEIINNTSKANMIGPKSNRDHADEL